MMEKAAAASMRETAYRGLRRLLVLQKIPERARLREPEWAEKLGVNRTALREAFARLEAEGLIEKGERTGYIVPALTPADIDEIFYVRLVLECAAIDLICASPAKVREAKKALAEFCKQFESFATEKYSLGTSEADRRFHESLLDLAGNRRLALVYHRAPLPLIHSKLTTEERWIEQCKLTAAEHRAITKCIADSDARLAKEHLTTHLHLRHLLPIVA
jgi:DNA-binding GntR family transcriptional regulator